MGERLHCNPLSHHSRRPPCWKISPSCLVDAGVYMPVRITFTPSAMLLEVARVPWQRVRVGRISRSPSATLLEVTCYRVLHHHAGVMLQAERRRIHMISARLLVSDICCFYTKVPTTRYTSRHLGVYPGELPFVVCRELSRAISQHLRHLALTQRDHLLGLGLRSGLGLGLGFGQLLQ